MAKEAVIIFPHQLFEHHPSIVKGREVWYVEDDRFFNGFGFHKKKLLLHRASMRFSQTVSGSRDTLRTMLRSGKVVHIGRHRDFFAANPRLSVMVQQFDRMERNRARKRLQRSEEFLARFG